MTTRHSYHEWMRRQCHRGDETGELARYIRHTAVNHGWPTEPTALNSRIEWMRRVGLEDDDVKILVRSWDEWKAYRRMPVGRRVAS